MSLESVVNLLKSFDGYVRDISNQFDFFENLARKICPEGTYNEETVRKKVRSSRLPFFEGSCEECEFSPMKKL